MDLELVPMDTLALKLRIERFSFSSLEGTDNRAELSDLRILGARYP